MSQTNLERHHSKGWGVARHMKKLACDVGDSKSFKKFIPRGVVNSPVTQDFYNHFFCVGSIFHLNTPQQVILCGLSRLESEIVEHCRLNKPTQLSMNDRNEVIEKISNAIIADLPNATVDVYGSYRTGLYLPTSDIDIVIFFNNFEPYLLQELRQHFIGNKICDEKQIYIINASVPIIRIHNVLKDIRVDISFNVENAPSSAYFIQTCVKQYPELQPLMYVLKTLLRSWELNESYSGGLSSYSLSLLLIYFLRYFPRSPKATLGSLLLEFLHHYGCIFNSYFLGVSYMNGVFEKPVPAEGLVIIDVIDPENDVAKASYKYKEVLALFKGAYMTLSEHIKENKPKILESIFKRESPHMKLIEETRQGCAGQNSGALRRKTTSSQSMTTDTHYQIMPEETTANDASTSFDSDFEAINGITRNDGPIIYNAINSEQPPCTTNNISSKACYAPINSDQSEPCGDFKSVASCNTIDPDNRITGGLQATSSALCRDAGDCTLAFTDAALSVTATTEIKALSKGPYSVAATTEIKALSKGPYSVAAATEIKEIKINEEGFTNGSSQGKDFEDVSHVSSVNPGVNKVVVNPAINNDSDSRSQKEVAKKMALEPMADREDKSKEARRRPLIDVGQIDSVDELPLYSAVVKGRRAKSSPVKREPGKEDVGGRREREEGAAATSKSWSEILAAPAVKY